MLGRLSVICGDFWLLVPGVLLWDGIGEGLSNMGFRVFFLQAEGVKMSPSGL